MRDRGLKSRVVHKAKGAPNLGCAFNIASFNVGIAGGACLAYLLLRPQCSQNPYIQVLSSVIIAKRSLI